MHAAVVEVVTPGPGSGCRRRFASRGRRGSRRDGAVHAARQQIDSPRQFFGQIAVEHRGRHRLVAVALLADAADAELRLRRIPLVDLQVAFAAARIAQRLGHHAQAQPGLLVGLARYPLAQEQDVRLHVGRRDLGEGAARQADRAQQHRLRREVAPHGVLPAVHRVAAGDETGQPTGPQQIERAAEEVVVDAEAAVGPVARIGHLVGTEGHVADRQVVPVIGERRLLERSDAHVHTAGAVERPQHPARKPVDLDGRDRAVLGQRRRHRTKEVADAGARFEHTASIEPKASNRLPHRRDHCGRGVVAVVDRRQRRAVVIGVERVAQLRGATCPGRFRRLEVEARGQATPAGVAQQRAALVLVGLVARRVERAQGVDRGQVGLELGDGAARDVEPGGGQLGPGAQRGAGRRRLARPPQRLRRTGLLFLVARLVVERRIGRDGGHGVARRPRRAPARSRAARNRARGCESWGSPWGDGDAPAPRGDGSPSGWMDGPPDAQAHGWVALVPREAAIIQSDAVSVRRGHRAPGGARRGLEAGIDRGADASRGWAG
ncbi:hypothetical protein Y694_04022 [Methylibium sp. T29-B]|nr:hypothetical protein Y694_04022 [Methylibium sp. T29-B]